jgi:hypothetical protein
MQKITDERIQGIKKLAKKGMANNQMLRDAIAYAEQSDARAKEDLDKQLRLAKDSKISFDNAKMGLDEKIENKISLLELLVVVPESKLRSIIENARADELIDESYEERLLKILRTSERGEPEISDDEEDDIASKDHDAFEEGFLVDNIANEVLG